MENDQLSAMLGNVLSNPAIMAQLQGVLAGMGHNSPTPSPEQEGDVPSPAPEQIAPAAGESEGLMANAALMSQLPAMLGMLTSFSGGQGGQGKQSNAPRPGGKSGTQRTALLLALKPYLSEGRCEMIDAIVNLSRLGDLLGKPGDK